MKPEERLAVIQFCDSLTKFDEWMWRDTCSNLIKRDIDFNAPAQVSRDGIYYTIKARSRDGRKICMGYIEGGYYLEWEPPKR